MSKRTPQTQVLALFDLLTVAGIPVSVPLSTVAAALGWNPAPPSYILWRLSRFSGVISRIAQGQNGVLCISPSVVVQPREKEETQIETCGNIEMVDEEPAVLADEFGSATDDRIVLILTDADVPQALRDSMASLIRHYHPLVGPGRLVEVLSFACNPQNNVRSPKGWAKAILEKNGEIPVNPDSDWIARMAIKSQNIPTLDGCDRLMQAGRRMNFGPAERNFLLSLLQRFPEEVILRHIGRMENMDAIKSPWGILLSRLQKWVDAEKASREVLQKAEAEASVRTQAVDVPQQIEDDDPAPVAAIQDFRIPPFARIRSVFSGHMPLEARTRLQRIVSGGFVSEDERRRVMRSFVEECRKYEWAYNRAMQALRRSPGEILTMDHIAAEILWAEDAAQTIQKA